jgi:BMFP domain-containing protein YqiC
MEREYKIKHVQEPVKSAIKAQLKRVLNAKDLLNKHDYTKFPIDNQAAADLRLATELLTQGAHQLNGMQNALQLNNKDVIHAQTH